MCLSACSHAHTDTLCMNSHSSLSFVIANTVYIMRFLALLTVLLVSSYVIMLLSYDGLKLIFGYFSRLER